MFAGKERGAGGGFVRERDFLGDIKQRLTLIVDLTPMRRRGGGEEREREVIEESLII